MRLARPKPFTDELRMIEINELLGVGGMILLGIIGGKVANLIKVPKVTGYMLMSKELTHCAPLSAATKRCFRKEIQEGERYHLLLTMNH